MSEGQVVWAPERRPMESGRPTVFLAGSIDQGAAPDWQTPLSLALWNACPRVVVFNPRRPHWDASWANRADNPHFHEQVTWELDHLASVDLVLMHLVPGSLSPISLLELGWLMAARPGATLVSCPEGFWRQGNVDIMAQRFGVKRVDALEDLTQAALDLLGRWKLNTSSM